MTVEWEFVMDRSAVPHAAVCAEWSAEDDAFVLRVQAGSLSEAWSTKLIAFALLLGFAVGGIAFWAGSGVMGAVLAGVLSAALCAAFVGYLRLSLGKREITLSLGAESLRVDDGTRLHEILFTDLHRLEIVHDGAPSRIAVDSTRGRFRFAIGQLYRHNTLERFIAEVPMAAQRRLETAGLTHTSARKRGVLSSSYVRV